MKIIIPIFISLLFLSSSCSKKCKECYLVESEGLANEQITNLGEKCGDELDEIDGKQYTATNGPSRSYCE